jgi:hypothetical protein
MFASSDTHHKQKLEKYAFHNFLVRLKYTSVTYLDAQKYCRFGSLWYNPTSDQVSKFIMLQMKPYVPAEEQNLFMQMVIYREWSMYKFIVL